MSERKIIYSKRFPNEPIDDGDIENDEEIKTLSSLLPETAEEFLKDIEENTRYILNEEKNSRKDEFLETVKALSNGYEIDIDIYEEEWGYVANLRMCAAMYSGYLKNLIIKSLILADSFDLFKANDDCSYDVLLSLDYRTHDRYYKGEKKNIF